MIVYLYVLLAGCTPATPTETAVPPPITQTKDRSAGAFADTDPWILKTTDPNAARGNHGIFLGNGIIGATFGANGGADKDARSYAAGVYDEKETLKELPAWQDIGLPRCQTQRFL